jgi:hypothetical protein
VNPNLFGSDFDIHTAVQAIKAALKANTASTWDGFIGSAFGDLATAKTDADFAQYARNTGGTVRTLHTWSVVIELIYC